MAGLIEFDWEPLDSPGVTDAAEAATWARLQIQIGANGAAAEVLTRVLDLHARTVRDHVYGTVLPLAEWLARCWPHLFFSRRARPSVDAPRSERYAWERVRRWRYAGEGTALPNVEFSFKDDLQLRLRWWRDEDSLSAPFERVLFQSDGQLDSEPKTIQRSLEHFVASVLRRLEERAPRDPRTIELRETWQLATDANAPDHVAQQLAALLGLFWPDLPSSKRDDMRSLVSQDLQQLEQDLLQAATLKEAGAYLTEARAILQSGAKAGPATASWRKLWSGVANVPADQPNDARPWKRGWDAARRLRTVLGTSSVTVTEPEPLWAEVQSQQRPLALQRVDAIVAWESGRQPVRAISQDGSPLRWRFGLARDLHPVLFGPSPDARHAVVHSRFIAGSASVANAFAAELLAPAERVRELIGGRPAIDYDDLAEMAQVLGAPFACVAHQVGDHHLARLEQRAEADSGAGPGLP